MNVLLTNINGDTHNAVYSPEHKESVIDFYSKLINDHAVLSVKITFDNGEVLHMVEA